MSRLQKAGLIRMAQRAEKTLSMLEQGYSYRAIARALNVSPQTTVNDVMRLLEEAHEIRRKIGERYVEVQLAQLDAAILKADKEYRKNNSVKHGKDLAAFLDQRAKLLNLYPMPGKTDASGGTKIVLQFNQYGQTPATPDTVEGFVVSDDNASADE